MRILYLTGRENSYPRNEVMLRALRRIGEVDIVNGSERGGILLRSLRTFIGSMGRLRSARYDLVYVGFYGQLLMVLVGRLARSPILFDAFISTFDTLTEDRRRFSASSLPGKFARWLDSESCRLANAILLDTPDHKDYFVKTFDIQPDKIFPIPVGCNEEIFHPRPLAASDTIRVLYYSTYLPLHGTEFVVRAAASLVSEDLIRFRLVGRGPDYERVRQLARDLELLNVEFLSSMPAVDLAEEIARADICLGGHFGQSEKAGRVVPGKIYQILASARPLIAGDTPANRRLLSEPASAYLCPPGDAEALARAILELANDPDLRERLAIGGRRVYEKRASEALITEEISRILGGF